MTPEEEIKDPYILEFLGLKDEYSESDLEEALIRHLEFFLLELGGDFTFVARQKRLRVGDELSYGPGFLSSSAAVPPADNPETWEVHPRRCRPNASLFELCLRELGS